MLIDFLQECSEIAFHRFLQQCCENALDKSLHQCSETALCGWNMWAVKMDFMNFSRTVAKCTS